MFSTPQIQVGPQKTSPPSTCPLSVPPSIKTATAEAPKSETLTKEIPNIFPLLISFSPQIKSQKLSESRNRKKMLSLASKRVLQGLASRSPALQAMPRQYHERVVDHFNNPRNVGSFDKNEPDVGTGLVGAPACGDVMKLQIKVDDSGKIVDACFKTFGCGSAIASSSVGS